MKGESKLHRLFRGQRSTLSKEQIASLENNRGAVWIHAASVGEFEQARTLIEQIKDRCADRPLALTDRSTDRPAAPVRIVVTFFSPSGYEARKNYELADGVYYLPFATRHKAKKFLNALQPSMAIFVKYEFWPAYLKALKKREIPTYCISAIFRPTQRFFHWYGHSALKLLKCFTHIYVQDEASRRLLAEHGIHECSVAGDTRFDRVKQVHDVGIQVAGDKLTPIAQFVDGCERVIVAGSTWPKDEALLARWITDRCADRVQMPSGRPVTKLILVPHEIDETHLHYIFNLFKGRMVRYSAVGVMSDAVSWRNILQRADVLVIDTMGLLSSIYRFGHVAYIGGGFGVGIHNTIEAAVYGVPVVFGPNYHHFREAQGLIDAGAARSIKNYEALAEALALALDRHEEIGAKAAEYVTSELGATAKIYEKIFGKE